MTISETYGGLPAMSTPIDDTPQRWAYSPAEVAELLSVTRQHVHNLIRRGELKSTKIGTCRRIPATEIRRLVDGAS